MFKVRNNYYTGAKGNPFGSYELKDIKTKKQYAKNRELHENDAIRSLGISTRALDRGHRPSDEFYKEFLVLIKKAYNCDASKIIIDNCITHLLKIGVINNVEFLN